MNVEGLIPPQPPTPHPDFLQSGGAATDVSVHARQRVSPSETAHLDFFCFFSNRVIQC